MQDILTLSNMVQDTEPDGYLNQTTRTSSSESPPLLCWTSRGYGIRRLTRSSDSDSDLALSCLCGDSTRAEGMVDGSIV